MSKFLAVALILLAPALAHAACLGAVTSIALLENGPAIHVTDVGQNCVALPAAQVTIGPPVGLTPCAAGTVGLTGTKVLVTPDATGLNFQAVPGATGMAACFVGLVFTDGTLSLTSNLSVSLSSGVTATSLTSP